jgi:glycosyltransferase involved in cell wall biosynthesis
MRIALLIHELLTEGGGERQCISLARALKQKGHEVALYTSAYARADCFPEMCQEIAVKDVGRGRFPWLKKPLAIRGYLDMRRLSDAVEESTEAWNPHHWPAQWGAAKLKKKLGGSVIWMCNDVPNFHFNAQHHPQCAIDLTILVSKWAEEDFKAIYSAPTRVLGPGFDPIRFAPGGRRGEMRRRFGFGKDDFVLLWLGIFMPHRRLEDAIQALSIVRSRGKEARLLLAGTTGQHPEYSDFLVRLAKQLGVQHAVTFAGKVPDEEIRDFYSSCDAFLFPNDLQTWGLAVLEAMACGCPVLVSRGAGVQEALTDNENSLLFPARNPQILADKIELLIADPQTRMRIAKRGMELARGNYTWDQYASEFIQICETIIARSQPDAIAVSRNEREASPLS